MQPGTHIHAHRQSPDACGWECSAGEPITIRIVQPAPDMGDRCPHCGRNYADQADDQAPVADVRQEALRELLAFLAAGEVDVSRIGWRVVLLDWLIHQDESQKELARRCKVTEARVSQALKSERAILTRFYAGKTRQPSETA